MVSACDYLASLPAFGLGRANKLLVGETGAADTAVVLDNHPAYLGMK